MKMNIFKFSPGMPFADLNNVSRLVSKLSTAVRDFSFQPGTNLRKLTAEHFSFQLKWCSLFSMQISFESDILSYF